MTMTVDRGAYDTIGAKPLILTPVPAEDVERGDGRLVAEFIEGSPDSDGFCRITKESVGGRYGDLIRLRPWQHDLTGMVYARTANGRLRHREALIGLPRKNGKSALGSSYALNGLVMGPQGGEVYSCAADREQARIVFGAAKKMVQLDPQLDYEQGGIIKTYRDALEYVETGSIYKVLSSEAFCVVPETLIDLPDGRRVAAAMVANGDPVVGAEGTCLVSDRVNSTGLRSPSPCVTVHTHRHRSATCTADHPFLVRSRNYQAPDKFEWRAAGNLKPGDRVVAGIGWPDEYKGEPLLPGEAWAMGAWTGDGCNTKFRFTNADADVISALDEFARSIGSSLKRESYSDIQFSLTGVGKRRKSPGREWVKRHFGVVLAREKTVPEAVMTGTPQDWAAYLAGLFDTDGHVMRRATMVWTSVSRRLLDDCQALLARLGFNAILRPIKVAYNGQVRTAYQLSLSGAGQLCAIRDILPLKCEHKRAKLNSFPEPDLIFRSWDSDRVISVEDAGQRETVALSVERTSCHITNGLISHNTKEGLNPTVVVYDELHAAETDELYYVMTQAMGARYDPLFIIITTAGVKTDTTGQDSICYRRFQYGQKVASGEIIDPTFFMAWYGAPQGADHKDPEVWKAANPGYGDLIDPQDFVSVLGKVSENEYRTKRLDQWVSSVQAWLPAGTWNKCRNPDRDFVPGKRGIVLGFDGSRNGDSTALVGVTVDSNPVIKVFGLWERPVDAGPDWKVPRGAVKDTIRKTCRENRVREIAWDEWLWDDAAEELEEEGLPIVRFPQTMNYMGPATQRFYEMVTNQRLEHGGDVRLARHLENAQLKTDTRGARLVKDHKASPRKIDLAVAAVMAVHRAAYYLTQPVEDEPMYVWKDESGVEHSKPVSQVGFVW